jgi:hypothetical protein
MKIILRESQIDAIVRGRVNEVLGVSFRPDWNQLKALEDKLQKESNSENEVVSYYVHKYIRMTPHMTEEEYNNLTWDKVKSVVDSHNNQLTSTDNETENFIEHYNVVSKNYSKFECAYIWDDEEDHIQDSLVVVANSVMKNPSLLESVPKSRLFDDLKHMIKVLYGKTSIILYRVLFVKSLDDINYSNLGTHWTYTPKTYNQVLVRYLYQNVDSDKHGYKITPDDLYIIKVLSPISNISYPATLWAQICFGKNENEVTLHKTDNLKILKSKHFRIPWFWDIK